MEKILVLEKVENILDGSNNVVGRLATHKGGEQLKVKKGQGGKLQEKWTLLNNSVGKAINYTMGKYQGYDFVQDFVVVEDKFVEAAARKVGENSENEKARAVSLSYATNLACADKITPDKILSYAEVFSRYMVGNITVKDEEVFQALTKKTFIVKPEPAKVEQIPS